MLLITGANGQLGRLIVEEVLSRAPDLPLAVSVRDASAAADLAARGVEVRQADYHHLVSVAAAFAGVDRLLLMPTPTPDARERISEMRSVVRLAAEEGVRHIVYPGAGEVEGVDFPLLRAHTRVFREIEATGIETTLLRANIYDEIIAGEVTGAMAAGELAAPVGDARVAPVLRTDMARAIATVLIEDGHAGKTYDLTGRDAVSWDDLADLASERAGRPIAYEPIDDAHAKSRLILAGLPAHLVAMALSFYSAYRAGWSSTPSSDIERLTGRAPRPTLEALAAVLDGTAK
jgi:NAD(P)H dehydrogenase (quinone)